MSSTLSEFGRGALSDFTGGPRSADVSEDLGGGILVSRDSRPLESPRKLLAGLSTFSRAESAVHRGGSSRARSRPDRRSRSEALKRSLELGSRRSLPGNSRDLSPGLSSRFGSGRRESLPSRLSLPSLASLRSPYRGGGCLSSIRWGGIGASGRLGRLLDLSSKELGAVLLDESGRLGAFADIVAAFASLSRRICSLRSRTSDLRVSLTAGAAGTEVFGSATTSTEAGLAAVAFGVEVLASSTSPSSTSAVVIGFGVAAPWELIYH